MADAVKDLNDLVTQLDEVAGGEYNGEVLKDDPQLNEYLSWAREGLSKAAELLKAKQ